MYLTVHKYIFYIHRNYQMDYNIATKMLSTV